MGCGVTQFMSDNRVVMEPSVLEDISTNYQGAGIFVKQVMLKAGQVTIKHQHPYDHLSLLLSGIVTVETDEGTVTLEGPNSIVIKANLNHKVTTHTDALWLCIHPLA